MKGKFHTSNTKLVISAVISIILFIICTLICYSAGYHINIFVFILAYLCTFLFLSSINGTFPEIQEKELCQRFVCLPFLTRKFKFTEIEKIRIQALPKRFPAAKIYIKNEDTPSLVGFNAMSPKSIRPFVEELRSKGVQVECEPYRLDNGRMIYL